MQLIWFRDHSRLEYGGEELTVTCLVRNELSKNRRLGDKREVVYTMPDPGKPYMPRQFPRGKWVVGRPELRSDSYKAPFFIPTNATQKVEVWSLDDNGGYKEPTGIFVDDYGYGLHFSTSLTTLGCGRISSYQECLKLVNLINSAIDKKEKVLLEVL